MFDGLFPEPYNKQILKLLFTLAHWHGLAKLRQHTEPSLDLLESTTEQLGKEFHKFEEKTCPDFDTLELKREAGARQRRQAKTSLAGSSAPATAGPTANAERPTPSNTTSSSSTVTSNAVADSSKVGLTPSSLDAATPINWSSSAVPPTFKPPKHSGKITSQKGKSASVGQIGRRKKAFNRHTYKNHSLGDFVNMIRMLGTTDSYSTEGVCSDTSLRYNT